MQKEIFKPIPGYENYYQVSNLGRIKSLKRDGKILKLGLGKNKYMFVSIQKNGEGKTYRVHQLMAMAFLGHKPNGHKIVVDHIDGNRLNNNLNNLQLISQRENTSKSIIKYTSKYIGVSWYKLTSRWVASMWINGSKKHIGYFKHEIDAHKAYKDKLLKILKNE